MHNHQRIKSFVLGILLLIGLAQEISAQLDSTHKRWTIQTGMGWYYYGDYAPHYAPVPYHWLGGFFPSFRLQFHTQQISISAKIQRITQSYYNRYTRDDYFRGLLLGRQYHSLELLASKPISIGKNRRFSFSPGVGTALRSGREWYMTHIYGSEVIGENERSLDIGIASQFSIDYHPIPWLRISLLPGYNYYFYRSKTSTYPENTSTAHEWYGMLMVGVDF